MLRVLALQASHTVEHGRGVNRVYNAANNCMTVKTMMNNYDGDGDGDMDYNNNNNNNYFSVMFSMMAWCIDYFPKY